MLFSLNSYAELAGIEVKNLFIETEKRVLANRFYFIPQNEVPTYDLNLGLNLDILNNFYFDNKVVSLTNQNQFRFVGWHFESGFSAGGFDVYFRHFSGHTLDRYNGEFPQDNTVGIRFNLIGRGRR